MDANQVLGSSKETENYQRLDRLLISGGTYILRQLFDTKFVSPHALSTVLATRKRCLDSARFITTAEREKLFPPSGDPTTSNNFDITLLIKLFRNICNIAEPVNGWDNLPNRPEDQSIGDDLARIKYYRNEVHGHATSAGVSDGEFQRLWREISQALLRIVKIVHPDQEDRWKAAMEILRTTPAHSNEEINFEELLKMEIEEMKRSLRDLCLSTQRNTDSIRETKDAVEQVHDTVLQGLSSSASAHHGSNVVYNVNYVFHINNATNTAGKSTDSPGRQDQSFPALTALGNPVSSPFAHSYRNPSTADTTGSPVSPNAKQRPRPWHESDVDTGHQHFPDGTHAERDTRRLQRPYSEPNARDAYLDNSGQVPQWSSDATPKRSAPERVLQRPFSHPHVYGNDGKMQGHRDSAQHITADHHEESRRWIPQKNLYTAGAYGPAGSPFHSPDQGVYTPVRNQASVERTHVAGSKVEGGQFYHSPEIADESWSPPPDKDFRNPSFGSNSRHQRSFNYPMSSREPRGAVGNRDTEFAQTTPQKTGLPYNPPHSSPRSGIKDASHVEIHPSDRNAEASLVSQFSPRRGTGGATMVSSCSSQTRYPVEQTRSTSQDSLHIFRSSATYPSNMNYSPTSQSMDQPLAFGTPSSPNTGFKAGNQPFSNRSEGSPRYHRQEFPQSRQAWASNADNGHIRMSIECQWIGNDVELPSLREDVNMAIYHRFTSNSQLPNFFRQCLEEDKELVVKDVHMKKKICILNLHAQHQVCLERLWQDYRSGNLDDLANRCLISTDLLECYGASKIILKVTIGKESSEAFHRTCEPGSRSQSFSESGGTPSFSGMSRAKSMGNLTSLFGPEEDGTSSKTAARELFQKLCRRGCTLILTEAIQSLSQSSRDVIESSQESADCFVRKFPDLFSLSRSQQGRFFVAAVLAFRFCKNSSCSASSCTDLHVCPFYLLGTCSYSPCDCRRSHDVDDHHTERVLRGLDLGGLSSIEKMMILAKIAADTKTEWRTPISEIPQVCRFYNKDGGCTKDNCNRLHVCRFWIKDKCKFADKCMRNHTYQLEREQGVLDQYDMACYPDHEISEIISPNIDVD